MIWDKSFRRTNGFFYNSYTWNRTTEVKDIPIALNRVFPCFSVSLAGTVSSILELSQKAVCVFWAHSSCREYHRTAPLRQPLISSHRPRWKNKQTNKKKNRNLEVPVPWAEYVED